MSTHPKASGVTHRTIRCGTLVSAILLCLGSAIAEQPGIEIGTQEVMPVLQVAGPAVMAPPESPAEGAPASGSMADILPGAETGTQEVPPVIQLAGPVLAPPISPAEDAPGRNSMADVLPEVEAGIQNVPPVIQLAGPLVAPPKHPAEQALGKRTMVDVPIAEITDLESPPAAKLIDLTVEPDDLWERIRVGFAMPDLTGPLVAARQNWYEARPQLLMAIFERSRRYLYHIVDELEKRGMPTELALLPMVESAFNPMAYSRAHASGLWQFIPSTGKRYELQQNAWYDARRDIMASTTAALDYLQFLFDMHGDWHLALASYNWGENAVARAIEKNRARGLPTNYLRLTMPSETRNYVPKLQALKNIISNPAAVGLDLNPIPNEPYFATVPQAPDIDIKVAAKLAEMPVSELIALNPAYKRPVIVGAENTRLVLPADRVDRFLVNLENHDQPLTSWRPYTFKSGDRLAALAARHGISLEKLKQANAISPKTSVRPGFQLLVPVKGSRAAIEPLPVGLAPAAPAEAVRTVIRRSYHTVKRGETLASIAQRFKVSIEDLRRWNKVGRLYAGQKIAIQRETTVPTGVRKTGVTRRAPVKHRIVRTRG